MQMSNDVINLLRGIWYLKIEKAGEKRAFVRGGGECKRMINKQTPEMSIKNQPTVQTKTTTNSYFFFPF